MRAELWGEVTERPTYQHVGYTSAYRTDATAPYADPSAHQPAFLVLALALALVIWESWAPRSGYPWRLVIFVPMLVWSGIQLQSPPTVRPEYQFMLDRLQTATAEMDAFVAEHGRPMTPEEWEGQPGGPPDDGFGWQPFELKIYDTPGFDGRRYAIVSRYSPPDTEPTRMWAVYDVSSEHLGHDGRYGTRDDAPLLKHLFRGGRELDVEWDAARKDSPPPP